MRGRHKSPKRGSPGRAPSARSAGASRSRSPAALPATERRGSSGAWDAGSSLSILRQIHRQDSTVPRAVGAALPAVARAVDSAVRALRSGGRIVYVGAGTSGRLGALDAAECPPTFGVATEKVQAVMAGGVRAFFEAAEGAEDDRAQGRRDLAARKIGPRDVVIGIAASGRTPYTLGALEYARSRRAATVAVTSNPGSPITRAARIAIVTETGPEIVAGSTRMKAALAQKMVLHMISTAAMARLGHVYRGYMVGVRPTNRKLVERACNILVELCGVDQSTAAAALRKSGNQVKVALVMLRDGVGRRAAEALLRKHGGNLHALT